MGEKTERKLQALYSELSKLGEIFEENISKVIDSDGTTAFIAAKTAFDAAQSRIEEIEKEIADILGPSSPPSMGTSPDGSSKVIVEGKESMTQQSKMSKSESEGSRDLKGAQTSHNLTIVDYRRKYLGEELKIQKMIFERTAPRVIDPDGSVAYWAAKGLFDGADKRIKDIEKEMAEIEK